MGHVFHNLCVFINIPKWCIKVYKDLLEDQFLKNEGDSTPTTTNDGDREKLKSNENKGEVEKFHAKKVLSKLKSRMDQRHQYIKGQIATQNDG